jgi:hypothetical protein
MRLISIVAALATVSGAVTPLIAAPALTHSARGDSNWAVGPQYDSTHVYVAPEDLDGFVASFIGTFGGTASKAGVTTITPTPSETVLRFIRSPVGTLSIFGFKTPIPYPFGAERTGYLVVDLDAAVRAAQSDGANIPCGAICGSHWTRRGDPVAGRDQHATVCPWDAAVVREAADDPGKPSLSPDG